MKARREAIGLVVLLSGCLLLLSCADDSPAGSSAGDQVANTDYAAEAGFHHRLDAAGRTRLRLEGVSGGITVAGEAPSDSVVIAGVRRVRSESTQDAEAHLHLLEVVVNAGTDEVSVETDQPDKSYGRSYEVDYDVLLPADFDVDIADVNGQVVVDDVSGDTSISLVNGEVVAQVTMTPGGVVAIAVVNGGIGLSIPKTTSAEFAAAIVNGSISMSGLVLHDPVITSDSRQGTLGSGDGTISLSVVNGTISVVGLD